MTAANVDVAAMLRARVGDQHVGLRTREGDWTWDGVAQESARRAELTERLLRPGPPHVGVLLDNVPEFIFWLGGAALIGATVVGINPTRDDDTMAREIRHTDCQVIVTDAAGAARLRRLDLGVEPDRILDVTSAEYRNLLSENTGRPGRDTTDMAGVLLLLLFTSGTTGQSKAVRCTQGRLVALAERAVAKYGHMRDDVEYCCMPLFHGNALMALWAPALSVGATICLTPTFSASQFISDVRYFGATYFTYVGKAVAYVLATPERHDDHDNTLNRGFGTEASPHDRDSFERRFGAVLAEGYGSSEGGAVVAPDPQAPASALGRPAHGDVVVVDPSTLRQCPAAELDEHGLVLNPDEAIGEIVDRAGQSRFEGYYKNDTADAERLRNGWYWSGDLGYVDQEGFMYFAGRRGDWVRVDGENTSTLITERVLRRFPGVLAAAAFGVPDARSGDQLMAAIEVTDPEQFPIDELSDYLCAQADLGSKGMPRLLRVSARLPATGSNKILKRELQDQHWNTSEVVYRWIGRRPVRYAPMTASDKDDLSRDVTVHGRAHLLRSPK
jgi:fatty-acyl-CoA synthase